MWVARENLWCFFVKLDNTLITCDLEGNFNQKTAGTKTQTLVTVMKDNIPQTVVPLILYTIKISHYYYIYLLHLILLIENLKSLWRKILC